MGNFQDAGNEPDPPFHLLLQLFGANDLFFVHCRSLKKVKFSTDQFRPALGSGCCLIVTMLKKPQNCPISDFFDLTPIYFLSLLHYTDPVPPSSDPVPPITKQCRPILTQYHHGSTITTLYWSSATKELQLTFNISWNQQGQRHKSCWCCGQLWCLYLGPLWQSVKKCILKDLAIYFLGFAHETGFQLNTW